VLLYGRETCTIKARDTRRIKAVEIKYMREEQQDIFGLITKQIHKLQRN
jgi:hypothetical protein